MRPQPALVALGRDENNFTLGQHEYSRFTQKFDRDNRMTRIDFADAFYFNSLRALDGHLEKTLNGGRHRRGTAQPFLKSFSRCAQHSDLPRERRDRQPAHARR